MNKLISYIVNGTIILGAPLFIYVALAPNTTDSNAIMAKFIVAGLAAYSIGDLVRLPAKRSAK